MTQAERILKHLEEHGSITAIDAMNQYGIMRLASRISDLRKEGYLIKSETETVINRYGEKCCIKRYSTAEE